MEDLILETIAIINETCGPEDYEIAMGMLCDAYGTEYIAELLLSLDLRQRAESKLPPLLAKIKKIYYNYYRNLGKERKYAR